MDATLHELRYRRFALRHWRERMPGVTEAQWHAIESRIVTLTLEIERRERRQNVSRETSRNG